MPAKRKKRKPSKRRKPVPIADRVAQLERDVKYVEHEVDQVRVQSYRRDTAKPMTVEELETLIRSTVPTWTRDKIRSVVHEMLIDAYQAMAAERNA